MYRNTTDDQSRAAASALIEGWRQQQWTLRRIAQEVNRLNIRPAGARQWYASSVRNQLSVPL